MQVLAHFAKINEIGETHELEMAEFPVNLTQRRTDSGDPPNCFPEFSKESIPQALLLAVIPSDGAIEIAGDVG